MEQGCSPASPPCHCGDNPQLWTSQEALCEPRGCQQLRGRLGQLAMAVRVGAKDQGVGNAEPEPGQGAP